MIGVKTKYIDESRKVAQAVKRGGEMTLSRMAGRIRKTAIASIKPKAKHGKTPAGSPYRTRRGQAKRAIVYDVNKQSQTAVIGPRASIMGQSANAHEFGGAYKGNVYPKRPVMAPSLTQNAPAFAPSFRGSIGG